MVEYVPDNGLVQEKFPTSRHIVNMYNYETGKTTKVITNVIRPGTKVFFRPQGANINQKTEIEIGKPMRMEKMDIINGQDTYMMYYTKELYSFRNKCKISDEEGVPSFELCLSEVANKTIR